MCKYYNDDILVKQEYRNSGLELVKYYENGKLKNTEYHVCGSRRREYYITALSLQIDNKTLTFY